METTKNTLNFEVLSSREINNIIYFPDLVNPPSTNALTNKTNDMDIDSFEDENALEKFIITETQGFLVKLERELRPQPQFYALTGPGTHPGFYGAGKSETPPNPVVEYIKSNCSPFKENDEHKEVVAETESKVEKEPKKEKRHAKQTKTKQTKITSFTIKSNRKSNCEEKSDNNEETPQKNTRRKSLSTVESSSKKKIKISSGDDDAKLPEEDNSENKRDTEKPKKSSGNRGRPKGSLNKNKRDSITKNRKNEVDSSLSTSSLTSIKSTTSPITPTREGSLGMILNTDNFVVNTTAKMNSTMIITASSP